MLAGREGPEALPVHRQLPRTHPILACLPACSILFLPLPAHLPPAPLDLQEPNALHDTVERDPSPIPRSMAMHAVASHPHLRDYVTTLQTDACCVPPGPQLTCVILLRPSHSSCRWTSVSRFSICGDIVRDETVRLDGWDSRIAIYSRKFLMWSDPQGPLDAPS